VVAMAVHVDESGCEGKSVLIPDGLCRSWVEMLRNRCNAVSVNTNIAQKRRLAGSIINVHVLEQNVCSEKPNARRKHAEKGQQLAKAHCIPRDCEFYLTEWRPMINDRRLRKRPFSVKILDS
jgi:hypothetical protein